MSIFYYKSLHSVAFWDAILAVYYMVLHSVCFAQGRFFLGTLLHTVQGLTVDPAGQLLPRIARILPNVFFLHFWFYNMAINKDSL